MHQNKGIEGGSKQEDQMGEMKEKTILQIS